MSKKDLVFTAIAGLITLCLCVMLVWACTNYQLSQARKSGFNPPGYLGKNRLARHFFTPDEFNHFHHGLKQALATVETFNTTTDFDTGINLSKQMFIQQNMFGEEKYRYRPDIAIINARFWTGIKFLPLAVATNPEIDALILDYPPDHLTKFETDRHGFKKTSFSVSREGRNVFFLGDSFTEGLWVEPEDTFVNQVGLKLQAAGISITPVNLGVNGYSVLESAWMLEHFSPELQPEVVVLNLFPNDVHSEYTRVIMDRNIPEENYQQLFYYLGKIADTCTERNISLLVSVIPPKNQLRSRGKFTGFQDRIKQWSDTHNVNFIDPLQYFIGIGESDLYFPWDPHLSPAGQQHYANFLVQHLKVLLDPPL
jgi:lysophospholipase L1-like esterase